MIAGSAYILITSHIHDDEFGPKAAHVRKEEEKTRATGEVDAWAFASPAAPIPVDTGPKGTSTGAPVLTSAESAV